MTEERDGPMSCSVDDVYSVYDERFPRARKRHMCDACDDTIEPGHVYARIGIVFDRRAYTIVRCLRCQALHEHLREKCRAHRDGDRWPDEHLDCGLDYEEEWGPLPDEIAALAFVTPAEMQATARDSRGSASRRT